jgi:hypothetical protein|nr:MAG TPA: hypothetical protein [Caudoviricetes sp.]
MFVKRVFALVLFVCLLFSVSSASAYVVSHRYLIPGTNCTVEIPTFFFTLSSNATDTEPFIYEYDSNFEAGMSTFNSLSEQQSMFQMIAYDKIDSSLIIFCTVTDSGFKSRLEDESDLFFDQYASDWADEYYRSYAGKPLNPVLKYKVTKFNNIRCIELENGKNGKIAYSQVFVFFLKDKVIDFTFDYMSNSAAKNDKKIVSDIMNSIQDEYMCY